ncbi:hypothetical protein IAD21_02240 [Abditibacteriota bacterium]|nr:hypothetical protein IAD21_02240 [Abditibacteriota bacterium]
MAALVGMGATGANAQTSTSPTDAVNPRLELRGEEPTSVYFDRDTLGPQTPILFSARLQNPTNQSRDLDLAWKITDADGKVVWAKRASFTIEGGATIVRRELFDAPRRGGFLLQASASYQRKGADAFAQSSLPFAVTLAAPPDATQGTRPRSFFVLDAPSSLDAQGLDFYSRLGARVLRSPLPADPTKPDWTGLESQLGERLRRNLSSIALLDLGDDGSRAQAFWSRQVPSTLARLNSLSTWELSGDIDPTDLDAWSQLVRARRPDISLLSPLPTLPSGVASNGARLRNGSVDGATFGWPLEQTQSVHPAALRRLWLSRALAAREAGLNSFHLRRANAAGGAAEMTADYLSAIMAGASSMSEPVTFAPGSNAKGMARAAAFTMLSRTLEDAAFREQLFPKSPSLEGALFRVPRGSVAVLYAPLRPCKMTLRVSPAQVLDAYGNPIAESQNGKLEVELGEQPIYIASGVGTEVLSYALRSARVAGVSSLEAQLLPLSRDPKSAGPGSAAVRVRVQNIGLESASGQIQLKAPRNWKLARDRYDLTLAPGESKTFEFRAPTAPFDPKKPSLAFELSARGGLDGNWKWNAQVASAQSVAPNAIPVVDAQLNDWVGANWLTVAPNAAGVSARLAWKWDNANLYVAAQVRENALTARNPEASSYEFWRGFDAIQLAFGLGNGPETVPGVAPFRDADFGFLLSPWGQSDAQNFQGRLLRLWGGDKPYNSVADRIRWGGAVPGAKCAIGRDEQGESTIYEAKLPLSAIPGLNPKALAQKDGVVRFGFLVHNAEGTPLDWGAANGNFSWWDNTSTFLPEGRLTSALRSTLGFSLQGDVASPVAPPAVVTPPKPLPRVVPAPLPTPTPRPIPDAGIGTLPPPSPVAPPVLPAPPRPTPRPSIPPFSVPSLPPPSGPLTAPTVPNQTTTSTPLPPMPPAQVVPYVVPPSDFSPPRAGVN